jgi:hypothetical protein
MSRFESTDDFLRQLDSGALDGKLRDAFENLSNEQLKAVAQVLMDRHPAGNAKKKTP